MKKATNTKTTKRIETIKANNEKRQQQSKEKIIQTSNNENSIVNKKAMEIVTLLKETKDKNNEQFTKELYNLASILIQSKIKHINNEQTNNNNNKETSNKKGKIETDKRYRKENQDLKNQVYQLFYHDNKNVKTETKDNNRLLYLVYIEQLDNLYITKYNTNGEKSIICTDKESEKNIMKKLTELTRLNNAMDMLQDIVTELWYYIQNELEVINFDYNKLKTDTFNNCCLLKEFEIVKLHTTTYRNNQLKPVELWEKTFTNPIKETNKQITRIIDSKKAIKENTIAYQELENTIYNPFTEQIETFKQYKKACKLSIVDTMDNNGKSLAQTADIETIGLIEKILAKANFTRNQAYIFKMYFCDDHSINGISDTLKISDRYIKKEIANIKQKCIDTGIFKQLGYMDNTPIKKEYTNKKIACYDITDNEKIFICNFDSIGIASKSLKIDKGNISKVLKGILKQTKGFYFEYINIL